MNPTSWLEINLARLDANVAAFRATIGAALLCGTVKADAYGLGMAPIAQRLAARHASGGVDMLAVFSPAQAQELAALRLACPILLLMPMSELARNSPLYHAAATGQLHLTIHDRRQLLALDHAGRMLGFRFRVHLHADTGMSRLGLSAAQLQTIIAELPGLRHIQLVGICTHLASAESDDLFTSQQVAQLDRLLEQHRGQLPADLIIHLANTAATLRDRRHHRDMVRVGLGLYGYGAEAGQGERAKGQADIERSHSEPSACPSALGPRPILPIVRWLSRLVHVQPYPKGAPVGYNTTHRLTRDSILGVVPVGYADGYPRALSNRSVVRLPECAGGKPAYAPVLGRVNMDQIVIDLTDTPGIPAIASGINPAPLVEIISDDPAQPHALHRLAALADSNAYEMLCRLSPRLPRKYVS